MVAPIRDVLADMLTQERVQTQGGAETEKSEFETWLESQSQQGLGTELVSRLPEGQKLGRGDEGLVDKDQDKADDDNNTVSTAALTVASSSSGRSDNRSGRSSNRGGNGTASGKGERGNHPFWTRLPHSSSASASSASGDLAGDNLGAGRSAAYQKMLAGRRSLPAW